MSAPVTDKRRQWIKSLSPGHMDDAMLTDEERGIWIQSRTREEMALYLEFRADRMEHNAGEYAKEAFRAGEDALVWEAQQFKKQAELHRINARRCREGKRLIQRIQDDK